jgi:hypothetical protein
MIVYNGSATRNRGMKVNKHKNNHTVTQGLWRVALGVVVVVERQQNAKRAGAFCATHNAVHQGKSCVSRTRA